MDVENGKETVYYIYAAFNRAARFGDLNFHGSKYRFKRFFCLHSLPMGRLYRTSQDVLFPCKQFANLYSPTLPIWRWGGRFNYLHGVDYAKSIRFIYF